MRHSISNITIDPDKCQKICISTNLTCNLNCTYCYETKESGQVFDVKDAINRIRPILSKETKYGTRIKLHGGEPFLVFDKLKLFCETLWNLNLPETFMIHATTNGTLIHGEIQEWLTAHKNQICLKLSIDGNKEMHNINRPNSYDKIDIPFFLELWPDIKVKMTISPSTISSFASGVIDLHEKGFINIYPSFAEMVDWNNTSLPAIFYRELTKLVEYYRDRPDIKPISMFTIDLAKIVYPNIECHPCTIGTKKAYDFKTGKYYPCHLYFESTAGLDKSEELLKIDLTKKENLVSEQCSNCSFLNLCHTCYVANFLTRGKTEARDMGLCALQKAQFVAVSDLKYRQIIGKERSLINSNDYSVMLAIKHLLPTLNSLRKQYNDILEKDLP